MKIIAGMGTIEDFDTLVAAGADEIFCGFVPLSWNEKYDNVMPLNRREVLFYHVQIATYEDMRILYEMSSKNQIPVAITFNSLYYTLEQLEDVADIISSLVEIGFSEFIIADINLLRFLAEKRIPCNIHVSGELGEWNSPTIKLLLQDFSNATTHISRIIFHRKNTFEDIEGCIKTALKLDVDMEFEAFGMNEKCHYTGGFCNSMHCDEMVHLCQLEYRMPGCEIIEQIVDNEEYIPGESGCALCAISKLEEIGVTHLKIVGRGQDASYVAKDIAAVKDESLVNKREKCSHNCYYRL